MTHIRNHILRGLLAIIPLLLCAFTIQLFYILIDRKIMKFLDKFVEIHQIPGLGIVLLLISLYLIGIIVSNIIGHQFLKFIEGFTQRIPLINTIYAVGKQFAQGLWTVNQETHAFKKAVFVPIKKEGPMFPSFVVSPVINQKSQEEYSFNIIPAAPTPAHGFLFVVKLSSTVDPGWSIEETLKTVVSAGIISPKEIKI